MRNLWAVLFLAAMAFAQGEAPVRYIVQLEGEPAILAADRTARAAAVRNEQQVFRRSLAALRNTRAVGATVHVLNSVIVEAPAGSEALLATLPGVKRVELSRDLELHTDRIPSIHQITQAWERIGGASRAGEGIKIAILDTGIQHNHPAFASGEFPPADGFPQADREVNRTFTNNKVIVARSYDDFDARDRVGHGTAVAMVAAGLVHESPRGVIAGVAPRAWLGNYRVNRGASRAIPTDFALWAVEDAVTDGMNVINMSFGSNGLAGSGNDALAEASRNAADRGVVVVVSAGNSGPEIMMVDDSSSDHKVLSVGANQSDQMTSTPALLLPEGAPITNVGVSSNATGNQVYSGQLFDIERLDPSGLLCSSGLQPGSLEGRIPLILRGECNFAAKLRNAFEAGAEAAVIYNSAEPASGSPEDRIDMDVDADPTIPGLFLPRSEGLQLKSAVASAEEFQVVVRFFSAANNPFQLASFSSLGPSVDLTIKPDLVGKGANVYTAAQTGFPSNSSLYNESGYTTTQGTSFSAPVVAGAAATLMAARPWMGSADYRSMLVNSAEPLRNSGGTPVTVMHSGAGALNLERALQSTVTAYPVSVSFGAQDSTVDDWRQVIIRNISGETVTYELSVESANEVVPMLTDERITLGPEEIAGPVLVFATGGLAPGAYEGFLRIDDAEHGTVARVPYWMAVRDTVPVRITAPGLPATTSAGDVFTVYFRVHDSAGLSMLDPQPSISVQEGGGEVVSLQPSELYPNTWWLRYRMGTAPGLNRIRIDAGPVSRTLIFSAGI